MTMEQPLTTDPPENVAHTESTSKMSHKKAAQKVLSLATFILAILAIIANFGGAWQWFNEHGKTAICLTSGGLVLSVAAAIVLKYIADGATENRQLLKSRSRFLTLVGLVALAIVLFVIAFVAPPPLPPGPPVLAQGHSALTSVYGIDLDLDTGPPVHQDNPGVDLSPSKTGDQINAMTHGKPRFSIPAQTDGSDFARCTQPNVWTKTLPNVYALRTGSKICVQTDQGNISVLTLTHIPSAAEQHIGFNFITWRMH